MITRGNSGVGAATAKLFAKEGAAVVITARREAALEKIAAEIHSAGGEVRSPYMMSVYFQQKTRNKTNNRFPLAPNHRYKVSITFSISSST